jgi:sulfate permease, SulP family
LFFGTITQVEEQIRKLLHDHSWQQRPIRFLLIDLSLVAGVDLSSAEALVRIQRLLAVRHVILVFCGFELRSEVGKALENVELFFRENVELFSSLNEALECTFQLTSSGRMDV